MTQTVGEPATPTIEGFTVYEVIGRGGFSRVYRAKQHSVGGREVAVKVLDQGFRTDEDRRLFESECLVAGKLDHPNIVRVYQATMTDDQRGCIVMERFAGTYKEAGRLSIAEVVDVGLKIADVLDEAHREGIVHHDLKPSNVFRSTRGEPALGDFGIATIAGRQPGKTRMTLRYAPPEKLSESISDASGDVYSFGATMYELASGEPPFVGDTDEELIRSIVFDPVPRLDRVDAPAPLVSLIRRCMAKDPAQRPTPHEIVEELRRIQGSVGLPRRTAPPAPTLSTRRVGTPEPDRHDRTFDDDEFGRVGLRQQPEPEPVAPAPEPSRRPIVLYAVATTLLVVAAAAVIWLTSRGGESAETTTTAPPVTTAPPDFVVVLPPDDFTVKSVDNGFLFTWVTAQPGDEIWIYRVGAGDKVLATTSPFVWELIPSPTSNCFEARTVSAGGSGLSQAASETVCA